MPMSAQPEGYSRRGFLTRVGATGGAGAMFATMGALGLAPSAEAATKTPFQPPQPSDFALRGRAAAKILILGAGVAGLAAAYELGKAGYDCTILEAQDRVGGRNRTLRGGDRLTEIDGPTQTVGFRDGNYLNAGPARIAQWMTTMDYARELGVPLEVFTNSNAEALIYNESAGMTAPVKWRTAKADVFGYISELLAKATDQGALDQRLTASDKERLLSFLSGFGSIGSRASGFAYTGGGRRGYSVDPGAGDVAGTPLGPVPSLSQVLASGVGRSFSFELGYSQAMLMFQPVGGMDAIPKALAKAVGPGKIRTGATVTRITNLSTGGVEVEYERDGRTRLATADYVIATLPPHILARIPHNLGAAVQSALRTPVPASTGKIGLEYRSRWWETEENIYGGITNTDLDLATIWYPSHGYGTRSGLIVGYYNFGGAADAYAALTHPERLARAVSQGAKIHGDKYRQVASSVSVAWSRQRHIEGGWISWPSRGAEYQLLNQPQGNVYYCGDWLSYEIAWQHGSFESARKVVTELHQRVLAAPAAVAR